jgi:hypothetical protein
MPGGGRPTSGLFATSPANDVRPLLFALLSDVPTMPAPELGRARYPQQIATTRSLGSLGSTKHTPPGGLHQPWRGGIESRDITDPGWRTFPAASESGAMEKVRR